MSPLIKFGVQLFSNSRLGRQLANRRGNAVGDISRGDIIALNATVILRPNMSTRASWPDHSPSGNQKKIPVHRKSDRRRDDLYAGGLRKRVVS